jgi:hypothetical protein
MTKQYYNVSDDIKALIDTNSNISNIQEEKMKDFLYQLLKQRYRILISHAIKYNITPVHVKRIYDADSSELTHINGAFIFETFTNADKNSILFVLKSKQYFLKPNIDKHLHQMLTFKTIIQESRSLQFSDLIINNDYNKMIKMIKQYKHFPENICLYIATDHISNNTIEYIKAIFNGFNETVYDKYTLLTLNEYNAWQQFILKLIDEAKKDFELKILVIKYMSMSNLNQIRNLLSDIDAFYERELEPYKNNEPVTKDEFVKKQKNEEMLRDIRFYGTWVKRYKDLSFNKNQFESMVGLIYLHQDISLKVS